MPFDNHIITVLRDSLESGTAVAVYRKPGSDVVKFCGGVGVYSSEGSFEITPWKELSGQSVSIPAEEDFNKALKLPAENVLPGSTPKDKYIKDLTTVIERLKANGGKTVISRTIHSTCPGVDRIRVAEKLFDRFPEALCYVFYHPELGAWMGATPELLLKTNTENRSFETMALAGTKTVDEQWDAKNRDEQRMVTDFIIDTLTPFSEIIEVKPIETLRYGLIEHLCTRIYGKVNPTVTRNDILDRLSPTPAVGGYPRKDSLDVIERVEEHDRGCYGGYLTFTDGDMTESYVILRCIQFNEEGYTAYSGSGITALSDPEKEWLETEAKAAPLIDIVESVLNEGR
ncbi:MAG: chorismate-binding protein [Muribaculaceae bacterium]|nr:chorismate-binding protein [Muribaculaceae bacterium]